MRVRLRVWAPGHSGNPGKDARALLSVAAIADVGEDPHEGEIARLVFGEMRAGLGDERLSRVLAWIIRLTPQAGRRWPRRRSELGLHGQFRETVIRERIDLYARKFLGRLRGKIPDQTEASDSASAYLGDAAVRSTWASWRPAACATMRTAPESGVDCTRARAIPLKSARVLPW